MALGLVIDATYCPSGDQVTPRHHPDSCVLVELSKEGGLREYYRHGRLLLHSFIKTRRDLCLYPRSVPHRPVTRQKWSHRTTRCQMSRNFATACGTWQPAPCGS